MDERRHPMSLRGAFRPILTFTLAVLLLCLSSWFVYIKLITGDVWFTTWAQLVGIMLAFFFGERSALKNIDPELERRGQPPPPECKCAT